MSFIFLFTYSFAGPPPLSKSLARPSLKKEFRPGCPGCCDNLCLFEASEFEKPGSPGCFVNPGLHEASGSTAHVGSWSRRPDAAHPRSSLWHRTLCDRASGAPGLQKQSGLPALARGPYAIEPSAALVYQQTGLPAPHEGSRLRIRPLFSDCRLLATTFWRRATIPGSRTFAGLYTFRCEQPGGESILMSSSRRVAGPFRPRPAGRS